MKRTFTIIAAASLVLCAACTKQESQSSELGGQTINLTLEATRGEAVETKTAVSYNDEYASLESVWSAGDKIYVYSRKSGAQLGILTQEGTILNQKASATDQYPTSYASFKGSVTIDGINDKLTDDFAFVYQGYDRSLSATGGVLTYEIDTSNTVEDLNKWDLAYAIGKIQGTSDLEHASCAVSFENMMAFGYFSTEGLPSGLSTEYYSGFNFDVKTCRLTGISATFSLPDNKKFYMPLVPGSVNMDCGKVWSKNANGLLGYAAIKQSKSFTASAGSYYRLGRNAEVSFGPVTFFSDDWTLYETLKDSKFSVAEDKEVYFTQGNLQHIGSANIPYWRIAPDQYSYMADHQGTPLSEDSNSKIPANTDVDLFGWGEVTYPFCGSIHNLNYMHDVNGAGTLPEDWSAKFNGESAEPLYADATQIYPKNGGDFCCLTSTEWEYLFDHQYWGFATVEMNNGSKTRGLVICPNTVVGPDAVLKEGETKVTDFLSTYYKSSGIQTGKSYAFSENTILQSTIDENGLLFLPAAGRRSGMSINYYDNEGYYWTTSSFNNDNAYYLEFTPVRYGLKYNNRYFARSVRLASVVVPTPEPK